MSATPRIYVSAGLSAGEPFELDEDQSRYLTRVMRLTPGDSVRVFNGREGEWHAELASGAGKRVLLVPQDLLRAQPASSAAPLRLLFAPVKKAETDFIIEKATELGAGIIQPVVTEYTQTRTVRLDRFNKIALEAAEQTERLDLPVIHPIQSLDAALERRTATGRIIYCDESGDEAGQDWGGQAGRGQPMAKALEGAFPEGASILVGPEGGFSPQERKALRSLPYCVPVSLGPRILRAETAVVAALTLWQALQGDWR